MNNLQEIYLRLFYLVWWCSTTVWPILAMASLTYHHEDTITSFCLLGSFFSTLAISVFAWCPEIKRMHDHFPTVAD